MNYVTSTVNGFDKVGEVLVSTSVLPGTRKPLLTAHEPALQVDAVVTLTPYETVFDIVTKLGITHETLVKVVDILTKLHERFLEFFTILDTAELDNI